MTGDELARHLEPIVRRQRLQLRRAVVRSVEDDRKLQRLKIGGLAQEGSDGVERLQAYGLTSRPLQGASAIVGSLLGDPQKLVALVVDDPRHRPTGLAGGEVLLYNAFDARIWLREDGSIRIESLGDVEVEAGGDLDATAVGTATVTAATVVVEASGDVEVNAGGAAKITAGGVASIDAADIQMPDGAGDTVLLSTVIAKYNVHEHPAGFGNNPTGPPDTLLDASDATTVLQAG